MESNKPKTLVIPNNLMMKEIALQISEGRSVELLCRGNSMNPFLCDRRDTLVLSPQKGELKCGDVVLARIRDGRFVVHRVVALEPLTLNGDGNLCSSVEYGVAVLAVLSGYVRKGVRGSVEDPKWRRYTSFWKAASRLRVGKWSLRRIFLGIWRRTHKSLVHRG